jgi:hypothetical protein
MNTVNSPDSGNRRLYAVGFSEYLSVVITKIGHCEELSLPGAVIARSVATKQSNRHVLPTEVLFFGMKFKNTHKRF